MKKIKKYKSGRRIYTQWDKITEQVRVISKKSKQESGAGGKPGSGASANATPGRTTTVRAADIPERFANFFAIHHTQEEFILDFFMRDESANKARHCFRVIMSPKTAKGFLEALKKCQ
ncbi:MAG: DUF3467 domain-containing protein [Elusimicrobiota bacterium]